MGWYYANGDQRVGPLDDAAMKTLATSKVVARQTLVWKDGMPAWLPANQTELNVFFPADVPPPLPPNSPQGGVAGPQAVSPTTRGESFEAKAKTGMIVSLCGILLFGLITGIIGIVFSAQALSGMAKSGNESGKGLAIAGLVIGIVDVIGWLILFA